MCLKYNVSHYALEVFFEKNNLLHRQAFLQKNINHTFFDDINEEIKAYLLGFYLADGCINNNRLQIAVSKKDIDIIELFRQFLCPYYKITETKECKNKKTGYISKPMCSVSILSEHICNKLEKYGIGKNKTYTSNFDFSIIPHNLFIHFIRGYFDGDGTLACVTGNRIYNGHSINYCNYNWSIISYKKEILLYIKEYMFEYYGIYANVLTDKRGYFLIEINRKDDFFRWRDILYENATYFLKRKKDKYFNIKKPLSKKIMKVKDGQIINIFKSYEEAGRDDGITGVGIKARIKNRSNINGFTWIEAEQYDKGEVDIEEES